MAKPAEDIPSTGPVIDLQRNGTEGGLERGFGWSAIELGSPVILAPGLAAQSVGNPVEVLSSAGVLGSSNALNSETL